MEKCKVLIVMHGAGTGGVEKSLKTLCKYIDRERFQIIVALPSEGPLKNDLDELGLQTIVTPLDSWTPIQFFFGERHYYQFLEGLEKRVRTLADIIETYGIEIVHSSTLSVADGAFAAKITGKPHIWHIHGKSVGTTNAYGSYLAIETLYSLVNVLSSKLIAVSEDVKKFLGKYVPNNNIHIIYNGVDLEEFDSQLTHSTSIREEFKLNGSQLVTLVGRIAEVKGIEDYIESAITVLEKRDDVAFLIVGPDEDKDLADRLKQRIQSLNLSQNIVLTGMRKDIPSILRESDIFVCSSKTEGLPYSCLEAMAASKPVVTTKCGGPEEMVVNGMNGFHVNVGRPDEMVKAITSLLESKQLMSTMGDRSREIIEEKFSAGVYARNFEQVYTELSRGKIREEANTWDEVLLHFVSHMGMLGTKVRQLEHEVRDLRNFESSFKNNFVYRSVRKLLSFFQR